MFILTLISSMKDRFLTETFCQSIANEFGRAKISWLFEKIACDVLVSSDYCESEIYEIANRVIDGAPIDVVVQRRGSRKKSLFLADMDSTIIQQECIDELADEIGVKNEVARITEAAMNGEIDFEDALRERVALLAGLKESVVEKVLADRIKLNPGARMLLSVLRSNNTHTALVSGGFTVFAEKIANLLGFHEFHANRLLSKNGSFLGIVSEPILGQHAKLRKLQELSEKRDLGTIDSMAVGDGANDLPMLLNAGIGVAFHAKPAVARQVKARIDHADLTALLFIQGYARRDIEEVNIQLSG